MKKIFITLALSLTTLCFAILPACHMDASPHTSSADISAESNTAIDRQADGDDCPDDGECPDDNCPDGKCPDDNCPDDDNCQDGERPGKGEKENGGKRHGRRRGKRSRHFKRGKPKFPDGNENHAKRPAHPKKTVEPPEGDNCPEPQN